MVVLLVDNTQIMTNRLPTIVNTEINQPKRLELREWVPNWLWEISSYDINRDIECPGNKGSSIGSHTLDPIAPPRLTSEITPLPPLNQKKFLRDLRSIKVKQICVLVAKDTYFSDIRSAMVFAEDERVLSSSSLDESVIDEKTWIERYTS